MSPLSLLFASLLLIDISLLLFLGYRLFGHRQDILQYIQAVTGILGILVAFVLVVIVIQAKITAEEILFSLEKDHLWQGGILLVTIILVAAAFWPRLLMLAFNRCSEGIRNLISLSIIAGGVLTSRIGRLSKATLFIIGVAVGALLLGSVSAILFKNPPSSSGNIQPIKTTTDPSVVDTPTTSADNNINTAIVSTPLQVSVNTSISIPSSESMQPIKTTTDLSVIDIPTTSTDNNINTTTASTPLQVSVMPTSMLLEGSTLITQSIAVITSQEGDILEAPAEFILFDGRYGFLYDGLRLNKWGTISFSRVSDFEVETNTEYSSPITVTINLLDGIKITDQLQEGGDLLGVTNTGKFSIPVGEITRVNFKRQSQNINIPMAIVYPLEGNSFRVPAYSLRYSHFEGYYSGSEIHEGLLLQSGMKIPFDQMKYFEISVDKSDNHVITASITLITNAVITEKLDQRGFQLQGPTGYGILDVNIANVRRVDFQR